jgi:uncharacterized protein
VKYLPLLLVALLVIWRWRSPSKKQHTSTAASKTNATPPPQVVAMQVCALCGTYAPAAEMLAGTQGHYCCAQHRMRMEP